MKVKIFLIILAILLLFAPHVFTKEATNSGSQEIEQFKEKLASKVAELQKKEEKATAGLISEIQGKQIKFKTKENETYTAIIDDVLTKYYSLESGSKDEIEFSDLSKNDYIIVSGTTNDKSITANNIYKDVSYTSGSGIINEINQTDYSIKTSSFENETLTIDIESLTKRYVINTKTYELEVIGFSKIKTGDIIDFIYKNVSSNKKELRFSATKIIIIPAEFFNK
jgi:hypothetical protein